MAQERRRAPRLEILGSVRGEATGPVMKVTLREISLGGLSVESALPFEVGTTHELLVTLGDGATVQVSGIVRHSRNVAAADDTPLFVTGLEFLVDEPEGDSVVGHDDPKA